MSLGEQVVWLFIMAVPIACIAWTVTQEEVFREARDYAQRQSEQAPQLWKRKFYHLLTCPYCISHYVTIFFLALTRFKLLYQDWRGYIIGGFALVWIANVYSGGYALLRQDLKKEKFVAKAVEHKVRHKPSHQRSISTSRRPEAVAGRQSPAASYQIATFGLRRPGVTCPVTGHYSGRWLVAKG